MQNQQHAINITESSIVSLFKKVEDSADIYQVGEDWSLSSGDDAQLKVIWKIVRQTHFYLLNRMVWVLICLFTHKWGADMKNYYPGWAILMTFTERRL